VLRPPDRVAERAGALRPGCVAHRLAVVEELLDRAAARLRDELGCVAPEVLPEQLEHAPLVPERLVELGRLGVLDARLALPRRGVDLPTRVLPRLRLGEEAVELLDVAEVLAHEHGRVRVPDDVVAEVALVLRART
jgi:hypothetical protein